MACYLFSGKHQKRQCWILSYCQWIPYGESREIGIKISRGGGQEGQQVNRNYILRNTIECKCVILFWGKCFSDITLFFMILSPHLDHKDDPPCVDHRDISSFLQFIKKYYNYRQDNTDKVKEQSGVRNQDCIYIFPRNPHDNKSSLVEVKASDEKNDGHYQWRLHFIRMFGTMTPRKTALKTNGVFEVTKLFYLNWTTRV